MTLPALEFVRRYLQHVPIEGLHRVRAFGLLHPARRDELHHLQLLLGAKSCKPVTPPKPVREARRSPVCKADELRFLQRLTADQCFQLLAQAAIAAEPATADARAPDP